MLTSADARVCAATDVFRDGLEECCVVQPNVIKFTNEHINLPVPTPAYRASPSLFAQNSMHANCPVCCEFLFDSIKPINIMQCGHTIHQV